MNGQVPEVNGEVPAAQQVPHQPTVVNLPSIERLTGRDNWSTWKFAVETYLELEDLWDVVKPAVNADGTLPPIDARKCRKARGKIILLLDPTNYVHVKDARTAREVWAKLEAAFEDAGLTRRVGLLRKLALSSTEAEFVALAEGCQELIWTRRLLEEVGEAALGPTTVHEDNQSCMKLVDSDKVERRSKHIETRYFFVRDLQEKGTINLKYCPTEDMLADLMTKPLAKVKLEKLRLEIGVRPDQIEEEC